MATDLSGGHILVGIGLNSGQFMSGNVGSARELEYTVHGDTVNTAIRLWTLAQAQGARFGARAIASVSDGPQTPR